MRPIVVIKTGSALPELAARRGDFEHWIEDGLGTEVEVCDVANGASPPPVASVSGVVVTGSSALVTDRAEWSERTGSWLREAFRAELPILGICYGHQLLADALGGEVTMNQAGRQIGTIEVELSPDAAEDLLFRALPSVLTVSSSHRQSVRRLPNYARRLGWSPKDPNQAYAIGRNAWGVQFHPEWDHDVTAAYLDARREILVEEGFDFEQLRGAVRPSEHGLRILRRFAEIVRESEG